MKTAKLLTVCLTLFCTNSSIRAQGFINLNFENASFTVDPAGAFPPYSVFASNAIPGWTAYLDGIPQMDILSNEATAGSAMVSLQGTNPPIYFEPFWSQPFKVNGQYFYKDFSER